MSKFIQTNSERDMIIISVWLSFVFLIGGLISLVWVHNIIYGILMGITVMWITQLIILGLNRVNVIKKHPVVYSTVRWLLRISVGVIVFSIIIWVINPIFGESSMVKLVIGPINAFSYLLSYSILGYAPFFIPLLDKIRSRNES